MLNLEIIQTVSLNSAWMSSFCMEQIKHSFHSLSLSVLDAKFQTSTWIPSDIQCKTLSWLIYNLDLVHLFLVGWGFWHSVIMWGFQRKFQVVRHLYFAQFEIALTPAEHPIWCIATVWAITHLNVSLECAEPQTNANYSSYVSTVQHIPFFKQEPKQPLGPLLEHVQEPGALRSSGKHPSIMIQKEG